jgi:hypothetical protein
MDYMPLLMEMSEKLGGLLKGQDNLDTKIDKTTTAVDTLEATLNTHINDTSQKVFALDCKDKEHDKKLIAVHNRVHTLERRDNQTLLRISTASGGVVLGGGTLLYLLITYGPDLLHLFIG